MKARLVIAESKPAHLADVVGFWNDETLARIVEQHGNRGFCWFRDDVTGRVVAMSMWESDADADAAGLTVKSHLERVSGYLASTPQVERLDVGATSSAVLNTGSI
jgi:hypothetical protein